MNHSIPAVVPPVRPERASLKRGLPMAAAFGWLAAGWSDINLRPTLSYAYGISLFVLSVAVITGLFQFGWDAVLFPALAGFMVIGPAIAIGLYEKSRRLSEGRPVTLRSMILVEAKAGGQILFIGAALMVLMLLWMRAAVIVYALFFGLRPFPGLDQIAPMLFLTPTGWIMLMTGGVIGGLFAAFSFAISVFSVPMLLDRRLDALTAMGTSMAMVWNNLPVMLCWGAIVMALFALSVATGLLGLILVFPLLGHATWHAYRAVARPDEAEPPA